MYSTQPMVVRRLAAGQAVRSAQLAQKKSRSRSRREGVSEGATSDAPCWMCYRRF